MNGKIRPFFFLYNFARVQLEREIQSGLSDDELPDEFGGGGNNELETLRELAGCIPEVIHIVVVLYRYRNEWLLL